MAKQCVTFLFENPNRADTVEKVLQKLLIDKLAAKKREETAAV